LFSFEVSQAPSPLVYEMFEEPFEIKDGYVHAPTASGLGFTLRADVAKRFPFIPGPQFVY
jgi:L-alanine-DL-glutamate epimerase-like enolase superfamily enzyme